MRISDRFLISKESLAVSLTEMPKLMGLSHPIINALGLNPRAGCFFFLCSFSCQSTSRVKPIFPLSRSHLFCPNVVPFCPQRCSPVDGCLCGPRPPAPRRLSPRRSGLDRWPFGDAGGIGMHLQSFHLLSLGLERTVWGWKGVLLVRMAGGCRDRLSTFFFHPPRVGGGVQLTSELGPATSLSP